jgi:hypothetical protein
MKKARRITPKAFSGSNMPEWECQFMACCNGEQVAARALKRLEQARLASACRKLLFEYSGADGYFAEMQCGVSLIVANIQAFGRADHAWKSKSTDPRAQLFRQRFDDAARVLMETPWPCHNPAIRTFGELYRLSRSPHLFNLRKIRALIGRSKLSFMLVMLWAGAEAHGVSLSGNELAALAYCASGQELDGSAVRRILREPWIAAAEPGYRAVSENSYCRSCLQQF